MTPEYRAWLIESLAPLGAVSVRRVFGFQGLYLDGTMFGLVTDERLYLKTDAESRKTFETEGKTALEYTAPDGEHIVMSYWEIPDRLYDEPEELRIWARRAHEVALKSATAKKKRKRASPAKRSCRGGAARMSRSDLRHHKCTRWSGGR